MMEFEAGDRVKVIGQDIVGTVLRVHYDTNEVVTVSYTHLRAHET